MENIYSQTEMQRNSIAEIPEGYAKSAGNTLYAWLGSLWRSLNKGDGMVSGLQSARGERLAQMYLDVLEAALLQDRNNAPVFHRELWHPIVIRKSRLDSAQANMLRMGGDELKMGEQPEGSKYGEGTVFEMGRMAGFAGYATYPVGAEVAGGAMAIVDNMVNPAVYMERGKDFDIIERSVVFPLENDPLSESSPFEKYDVPSENPEDSDVECVLWASDVLIDRNYIADHLSYILGADAPSSDVVKRIVNAAWSSVTSGLTPELFKTLLAAMLNVPVIQNEAETVKGISVDKDTGATLVRTDSWTYKVSPKAKLLGYVKPGAKLKRGDFLDESVRIYAYLNALDWGSESSSSSSAASSIPWTKYSVPLELDLPSVVVPPSLIKAKTEFGIYAMWSGVEVRAADDGNPNHLYFDIGGTDDDVKSFWNGVWEDADRNGIGMESVIGAAGRTVSPAEFFLRNLVGANTVFVVVDDSQVDDSSMMHNPMFFDMLTKVIPSAIRVFVVEHRNVAGEDDVDLGDLEETAKVSAALPQASDGFSCDQEGGAKRGDPSFGELVSVRFVRRPPAKVRGTKEED